MPILWASLAFLGAVTLHALLLRVPLKGDSVTKFALAGGTIGIFLGLLILLATPTLPGLAALVVYAFAAELYVFLFTLVGSSVSARILLTLRAGPRTAGELDAVYATAGMVEGRIARLKAVGLLDPETGAITPRGALLARLFRALKHFFRHTLTPETSLRPSDAQLTLQQSGWATSSQGSMW
jgi:hypothetical protein